ncbi:hypothetical protein [Rhodococcus opacus]|uniref:hypothetical protein n=1 Tax=Rhodococcus opacus TaxID=37919 RepID=UPI0034D23128
MTWIVITLADVTGSILSPSTRVSLRLADQPQPVEAQEMFTGRVGGKSASGVDDGHA